MAGGANPGVQAVGAGKATTRQRGRVLGGRCGAAGQSIDGGRDRYRFSRGPGCGGVYPGSRARPRTTCAAAGTKHTLAIAANDAPFSADPLFPAGGPAQCGYTRNLERSYPRRIDAAVVERAAPAAAIDIAGAARAAAGVE